MSGNNISGGDILAIILIRTIIIYVALLISMRLMGKRQLGEMEISEFIVAALIADLAATPLQDIGIPFINGLVPIITLFTLETIIAGMSMKSVKVRKLLFGTPEIIIKNGKIDQSKMLKNRFTLDELMQELRSKGLLNASTVEYGVLETNGKLNIILKTDEQPLTPKLMNINTESPGYTYIIINEGRIISNNLKLMGRDENWLYKELKNMKINRAESVYLFTLSENGNIFCQKKENSK